MIGVYVVGITPCSATLAASELAQSTASVSGTTERIQERGYIVVAPMGYTTQGGYGMTGDRTSELGERDVMNVLELTLEEFNVDRDRV